MAKSTSLAALHPQSRAAHAERAPAERAPAERAPAERAPAERAPAERATAQSKPRKRATGTLARRAQAVAKELSALPVKPLLIGAGIGAALLGTALAVSSKRPSLGSPFSALNQTLTKTALVALARVVSGQTVRSVATSALLDVADAMKS